MAKLSNDADAFYVYFGENNKRDTDNELILDDKTVVNLIVDTFRQQDIPFDDQVGDTLFLISRYYQCSKCSQCNQCNSTNSTIFNMMANYIYELVVIDPVDYENDCGLIHGFMKMMKDVNNVGRMIRKHMTGFDKLQDSAELGGCYIIYCNIAMRVLSKLFPDYITSEKAQLSTFEKNMTDAQKNKKDRCVTLWMKENDG